MMNIQRRAYFSTPYSISVRRGGVLKYAPRRLAARTFRRRGFTLIEAAIILAMLAVVAALVAPQFSSAQPVDRAEQLRQSLERLRTQITIYRAHHGTPPEDLVKQLTGHTDAAGALARYPSADFRFGPYMRELPANPINGLATVRQVEEGTFPPHAAGTQ